MDKRRSQTSNIDYLESYPLLFPRGTSLVSLGKIHVIHISVKLEQESDQTTTVIAHTAGKSRHLAEVQFMQLLQIYLWIVWFGLCFTKLQTITGIQLLLLWISWKLWAGLRISIFSSCVIPGVKTLFFNI